MIRLIKRYGSRKLYDTEESRYVHLEDVAGWIRQGQEIRVIDNQSGEDVTSQTLTQIISEEGRRGRTAIPDSMLHEIIRFGQQAVTDGVDKLQQGMDRVVRASVDRLGPIRRAREEMEQLRARLQELDASLIQLEAQRNAAGAEAGRAPRRARPSAKATAKKSETARSKAAGGTTPRKAGARTTKGSGS